MDLLVIFVVVGGILLKNNVKCEFKRVDVETTTSKELNNNTTSNYDERTNTTVMENYDVPLNSTRAPPNNTFTKIIDDKSEFNGTIRMSLDNERKVFVLIPFTGELVQTKDEENVDGLAHTEDDTSVADTLKNHVKVLCWVMTSSNEHKLKAIHVKQTWGKRCNKLLFFSTEDDLDLPAIKIGQGRESSKYSWDWTKEAYRHIYLYHLYDADWFLQADDVTYVVVENLRYMLLNHNSTDPIYFGSSVRGPSFYKKQVFRSSLAGVVLSREAVTRFIVEIVQARSRCNVNPDSEDDQQVARCLNLIGVRAVETKDMYQRGRLFPTNPHNLLTPRVDNDWYWTNIHRLKTGRECCSEQAVTFYHVPSNMMYALEYLIYHLRPYGISYNYYL